MQPQSSLFRRAAQNTSPLPATGASPSSATRTGPFHAGDDAAQQGPSTQVAPTAVPGTSAYTQSSLNYRGGPGSGPAGGARGVAQTQQEENDELIKALLHDVRRAKHKFGGLGDEVRKQNTLLEQLEERFRGAGTALKKTIQRLDAASSASGFKHMWILFLFVIVFFMFIYLLLKFRR